MRIKSELRQRIRAAEYVYSTGKLTRDAAETRIEALVSEGDISPAEKPRAVSYRAPSGAVRWAIVLTDTALEPLM